MCHFISMLGKVPQKIVIFIAINITYILCVINFMIFFLFSANRESGWPQHFETGNHTVENPERPGHSSSRAQKYVVDTQPVKELTGAKYITVPDTEPQGLKYNTVSDTEPQGVKYITVPDTRPQRISDYTMTEPRGFSSSLHQQTVPKTLVSASPRPQAKYQDSQDHQLNVLPAGTLKGNAAVGRSSHFATVRLVPEKMKSHKMATVRGISPSAVRSAKGYHLGYNATVRGHNTGHIAKQVKQSSLSSWDIPDGTLGFRRTTTVPDRKEYCFNQFAIELDKPDREECYRPGEVISGKIILEVNTNVEIRFVELLILGLATVHFEQNDPDHAKNDQEVIVKKRSYIMGKADGRWNSVITEGKYVSKFRFILPKNVPSSIKYENKEHGMSFEIGYLVKARICDELGSSSARSTHSLNKLVKVLMTRKHPFFVRRPFDINAIPTAMKPINHTDFINLNCLPISFDTDMLTLSLDRSVFLAGDIIRVKLTTTSTTARKIKHLLCQLQMRVTSSVKPKATYILGQIEEHEPEPGMKQPNFSNTVSYDFMIPTHYQFIPTYLQGTKLLRVSYCITMNVTTSACAGILTLEAPIAIGPCTEPQNMDKTDSVPIFNRPMRFPYFSKDNNGRIQNGMVHSGARRKNVKSERKPRGRSLFLFCVDKDA